MEQLPALDPIIHPANRLRICAALSGANAVAGIAEMRFARLKELTGLSDPTLSKQLTTLEKAGYISRFREYGSTRAKDTVWIQLTEKGKKAFDRHVTILRALAALELDSTNTQPTTEGGARS